MSGINLHCTDGNKFTIDKPNNHYGLAIIDCEYGIGQGGDKNHTRSNLAKSKNYHSYNDSKSPDISYFNETIRVSRNQIFWGANHFISKIPYDSSGWIVWDKENGKNDFADCELAWTSFDCAVRIFNHRWTGMLQKNMKNKQIRIHPNEKPIELYEFCIINYAKKGDIILDTRGGGGSILLACHNLGFDIDWCENDSVYFNDAKIRYENHIKQARNPMLNQSIEWKQTKLL